MTLRRRILFNFLLLTAVNGLVTLFIIEAVYLTGGDYKLGENPIAPGFGLVAASLIVGAFLVSYLLFWTLRRLVLDPLEEIVVASRRLADGEAVMVQTARRGDEIGQLADSFNLMAETVAESRRDLEGKIQAASEKIQLAQRELAFSERLAATGRLAAGVAHEINNPLGGVMNAMARLRKESIPPERAEKYWAICDDGLDRIRQTVRRILDFSRKRPDVGPVSMTDAMRRSLDLVGHLLEPARVRARIDGLMPPGGDRFLVLADSGDLQHVFVNLIINAIDAMPEGGELVLSVGRGDGVVRAEVIDTGIGLSPEEIASSFELFHTTKPVGKGTGLGLSIAHHIVAAFGGSLTLSSRKGEGTTASVVLPAHG